MKITVDNVDLFTLNETKKKVIQNDIPMEVFDNDMKRRIAYIIAHKYERCFERLKKEWVDGGKLAANGVMAIPTNPDALANLIFAQPNYKSRQQRFDDELASIVQDLPPEESIQQINELKNQQIQAVNAQLNQEIIKFN